jgi:hypothetical protein
MVCSNSIEHSHCTILIRPDTLKPLVEQPCCCSVQKYESPYAWTAILHCAQRDNNNIPLLHNLWTSSLWVGWTPMIGRLRSLLFWLVDQSRLFSALLDSLRFQEKGSSTPSQPLALQRNPLPTSTFTGYLFTLWYNVALAYERNPQP